MQITDFFLLSQNNKVDLTNNLKTNIMKNFETQKVEEFEKAEVTKSKFTKFVDDEGVFVYDLELPNGKKLKKVDADLALYVHFLEKQAKL